jgi:hypothetical protein
MTNTTTLKLTLNGTGFAAEYTAQTYGLIPHKNGVAIELVGVTSGKLKHAQRLTARCQNVMSIIILVLACLCSRPTYANEPFLDVTEKSGLKGMSGGVAAWGDFDNDGWTDLYTGGKLWHNEHGRRFSRVPDVPLQGPGIWGDFDNDGFLDLFSWSSGGKLFRNRKGQGFEDVSQNMPRLPMKVSLGATWGDFDGDGFLDLYVGGYEIWQVSNYIDVIYRNQGNGTFEEVWRTKGRLQPARGITAADFDEDGDLDVYVSNYRLVANILWQNDGKGRFQDVAAAFGTAGDGGLGAWGHTIGSAWGDLDNDGHLDLFVGNFSHPSSYQDRPKFLKNLGPNKQFHFEDKSKAAGLRWQESYASPALGDFDNDGSLDLYFTTVYSGDRSVLYRNTGNWAFKDLSAAKKVDVPTTYQAAWADFDNDGDLDLVTGGRLFRNPGGQNRWLEVRLVGGGKVNRCAIGTQVRIRLGEQILTRQVEGATGQGNQNDLTLHFGLGTRTEPVVLEIRWPGGKRQQMKTPVDRRVTITHEASIDR